MTDFVLPIVCIILLFFCMFLLTTLVNMREKLRYAEEKSKIPPTKSQELTEFLQDMKGHGYSFVRVDPDDVLMRTPRN